MSFKKRNRPQKFKNIKVKDDDTGRIFASKKEFRRFKDLRVLEKAGVIKELKCQVPFSLDVNGYHICDYKSDFTYINEDNKYIVEDVKGSLKTIAYEFKLKKNLMKAIHNIEVLVYI